MGIGESSGSPSRYFWCLALPYLLPRVYFLLYIHGHVLRRQSGHPNIFPAALFPSRFLLTSRTSPAHF